MLNYCLWCLVNWNFSKTTALLAALSAGAKTNFLWNSWTHFFTEISKNEFRFRRKKNCRCLVVSVLKPIVAIELVAIFIPALIFFFQENVLSREQFARYKMVISNFRPTSKHIHSHIIIRQSKTYKKETVPNFDRALKIN